MIRSRPLHLRFHMLLRWLHVYTSMISLLVVLFFSLTGITLNHPDWVFGNTRTQQTVKGTLPQGWVSGGQVDWLKVAEYLRSHDGVRGSLGDHRNDEQEASISFSGPGYSADAFIQMQSGEYTLTTSAQGLVAVLNDFHRGRDTGPAWNWVIDISGWFLTLVALTGLGLLIYLKKIRLKALLAALAGAAVMALMGQIT